MNNTNNHQSFFITITAEVLYDKSLNPIEKLIFAEISSLTNKEGYCFASNKHFADIFDRNETTISTIINKLQKKQYIDIEILEKEGNKRKIFLSCLLKNQKRSFEKSKEGSFEKSKHSNTVTSNTINKEKIYIKENDEKVNVVLPAFLKEEIWNDFLQHRKETGHPVKSTSVQKLLSKFEKLHKEGQDVNECILRTIESGYRGVFPIESKNTNKNTSISLRSEELSVVNTNDNFLQLAIDSKSKKTLYERFLSTLKNNIKQCETDKKCLFKDNITQEDKNEINNMVQDYQNQMKVSFNNLVFIKIKDVIGNEECKKEIMFCFYNYLLAIKGTSEAFKTSFKLLFNEFLLKYSEYNLFIMIYVLKIFKTSYRKEGESYDILIDRIYEDCKKPYFSRFKF